MARSLVLIAAAILMAAPGLRADDAKRDPLLSQMQGLASKTQVRYTDGERAAPVFVATPVFRYSDAPRGFEDATLWVWTSDERPVAFHKVEAMVSENRTTLWSRCFTSVSEEQLSVTWPGRPMFKTSGAGLTFAELSGAPEPELITVMRRIQSRRLSRQFTGRLTDPASGESEEMRLLPTPIYEYASSDDTLLRGAVFGLASNGTNPDILICLEIRPNSDDRERWHFGVARMTNGEVTLRYAGNQVWSCEEVDSMTGAFETWMFFAEPRTPPDTDQ